MLRGGRREAQHRGGGGRGELVHEGGVGSSVDSESGGGEADDGMNGGEGNGEGDGGGQGRGGGEHAATHAPSRASEPSGGDGDLLAEVQEMVHFVEEHLQLGSHGKRPGGVPPLLWPGAGAGELDAEPVVCLSVLLDVE